MAYAVRWNMSDRVPQFRFDPDVIIPGQKFPHSFLKEALPEAPERVPTRGVEITRKKGMPDIVSVSASYCVSEDVKALIEAREPGVHQFFPIALIRHSGELTAKAYYLLNILTTLDSIIPEKSDVKRSTTLWGNPIWAPVSGSPTIVMRRAKIAGHHVWYEKIRLAENFYVSEELANEIRKAKLQSLLFNKTEEI